MFIKLATHKSIGTSVDTSAQREAACLIGGDATMQMMRTLPAVPVTQQGAVIKSSERSVRWPHSGRMLGLIIISTLPALFWTALIALLAPLAGYSTSPATLAIIAVGISAFLLTICSAFYSSHR